MRPEILALLIAMLAAILYATLGGADYGGGVWDLLALGPRKVKQRELIGDAMSPVWETNHVWLIFLLVLLFTCFPPVFAKLGERLFLPLVLALLGIVLRGAAFAFRGPPYRDLTTFKIWGVIFGIASVITPFILGACAGAIATGTFDWLRPMSLCVGLFAVALCANVAAVFLTSEARGELRSDFRMRSYFSGGAVALTGLLALIVARIHEPVLISHLLSPVPLAMIGAAMALAVLVIILLRANATLPAMLAAGVQTAAILGGWYAAQGPYLAEQFGVADPAAPHITIVLFLWSMLAGSIVLIPSLLLLFGVFKRKALEP